MALGSTQPLTEMSTRNLPGGKGRFIRRDLHCPTIAEEIRRFSSHYGARLRTHPNHLSANLLGEPVNRRLRRYPPTDLPDGF
jgi:hypothetical protein